MPRNLTDTSDVGSNEAPEAMAEAMMEAKMEKKNKGQEVELGKAKRPRMPSGGTTGKRSGGMHGGFHDKRSKY